MKISKLIQLLAEQMAKDGDNEVVIEADGLESFLEVYDVTGRWSTFDRSKYDGSPVLCFIHGREE